MTELAETAVDLYNKLEDLSTQTPIQNRYTFWFHRRGGKNQTPTVNYEESMKMLESFQTVEHFWRIYNHMIRPNEFRTTTDYHLFKDGIKPTWEDPLNKNGGKWMIRLRKGLASRLWEELVLAIIGEQFDVGQEICGAVVSVRHSEDIISVWNKTADNVEATSKIRDQMRRILRIPANVTIEYKKHQDSLVDKSSFRNPTMVWRAPSRVSTQDRDGGGTRDGQRNSTQGGGGGGFHRGGGGTSMKTWSPHNPQGQPQPQQQSSGSGWARRENSGHTNNPNPDQPQHSPWGRSDAGAGTGWGKKASTPNANASSSGASLDWSRVRSGGGAGGGDKTTVDAGHSDSGHNNTNSSNSVVESGGGVGGFNANVAAKLGLSAAPTAATAGSGGGGSTAAPSTSPKFNPWNRKKKEGDE